MSPESIRREVASRIMTQIADTLVDLTDVLEGRALELLTDFPPLTFEEIVGIIIKDCVARQDLLKELA